MALDSTVLTILIQVQVPHFTDEMEVQRRKVIYPQILIYLEAS